MEKSNSANLDIWVLCSFSHLPLNNVNWVLNFPHIPLDLRDEGKCLALSARSETYMQRMQTEALTICERDHNYVPQINYSCHFYKALNGIQLPVFVPAAED